MLLAVPQQMDGEEAARVGLAWARMGLGAAVALEEGSMASSSCA